MRAKKIKVISIVGHSYCGSTLLTYLFANHSNVATIGEYTIASFTMEKNIGDT